MRDTALSAEPQLRRIFRKLFLVCEANLKHFTPEHQLWIKEYSLLAVVRNELYTDDSFLFNKRIGFVKREFESLRKPSDQPGTLLLRSSMNIHHFESVFFYID